MTPEERFELHEQWLRSMDSNHARFAERMEQFDEGLNQLKQHLANVQKTFADQMVILAMNQAAFAGSQAKLTEELRDLREVVDRYIRFRGDGNQTQN